MSRVHSAPAGASGRDRENPPTFAFVHGWRKGDSIDSTSHSSGSSPRHCRGSLAMTTAQAQQQLEVVRTRWFQLNESTCAAGRSMGTQAAHTTTGSYAKWHVGLAGQSEQMEAAALFLQRPQSPGKPASPAQSANEARERVHNGFSDPCDEMTRCNEWTEISPIASGAGQ